MQEISHNYCPYVHERSSIFMKKYMVNTASLICGVYGYNYFRELFGTGYNLASIVSHLHPHRIVFKTPLQYCNVFLTSITRMPHKISTSLFMYLSNAVKVSFLTTSYTTNALDTIKIHCILNFRHNLALL